MARAGARLGRQTFASAAAAAREFYDGNQAYFDHIPDPIDGLRAWADGIDVRTGRAWHKLSRSAAGRKIFEADQGAGQIRAALQWVFQQAKGRRWAAVDWEAIDELGTQLQPHFEASERESSAAGLYWWPVRGAGRPLAERLGELDPFEAREVGRQETADNLADALQQLRDTYAETRECLPPDLRKLVAHRIEQWSRWESDPSAIPEYACEPDEATQGYVCNFPLVTGELRELGQACRRAYDPDWYADESDADAPGFPPPADVLARGPRPQSLEDDARGVGPRDDVPLPTEAPDELELEARACPPEDLDQLCTDGRAFGSRDEFVAEVRDVAGVRYQLEFRQCGKRNPLTGAAWCRCYRGEPHGPYWYAYWRDSSTGRRRSQYIGKTFARV